LVLPLNSKDLASENHPSRLIDVSSSSDLIVSQVDGAVLYFVCVDLEVMTYKIVKMKWGIIGTATSGG
jgi:hypothetical protein